MPTASSPKAIAYPNPEGLFSARSTRAGIAAESRTAVICSPIDPGPVAWKKALSVSLSSAA